MTYDTNYQFAETENLEQLENLEEWALCDSDQDIRNCALVTTQGQTIGIIDDMLVDRAENRVAAVRLEDGRICPAGNLEIRDSKVVYQPEGANTACVAEARTEAAASRTDVDLNSDETITMVEEEVAIGKRAVAGDAIRVTSKVVTDTVNEDIALQREEVYVQTRDADRVIGADKADELFAEKTVEVAEVNEEAVVAKRAVVTGEIEVGKTRETEIETVSETARRTVVDIDTDADLETTS